MARDSTSNWSALARLADSLRLRGDRTALAALRNVEDRPTATLELFALAGASLRLAHAERLLVGDAARKHSHVVDGWTLGYAVRKYLNRGWIFQEEIEQYMPWEGARSITKINQVSGIRLHAERTIKKAFLDDVAVNLETGNSHPFKYTTVDVELGITPFRHFLGMPVVLWSKAGYNSDLAPYYKKVTSFGAALRFETFQRGSIPASAQ